jgi:chromate transporter
VIFATFAGFVADAWIGAFAITVGMFLPSFAFTLVGHRFVDRLVHAPRFHAALDGVAAAVVGIVTVTAVRLCMDRFDGLFSIAVFVVAWAVLVRARSLKAIPLVMAAAAVAGVLVR